MLHNTFNGIIMVYNTSIPPNPIYGFSLAFVGGMGMVGLLCIVLGAFYKYLIRFKVRS